MHTFVYYVYSDIWVIDVYHDRTGLSENTPVRGTLEHHLDLPGPAPEVPMGDVPVVVWCLFSEKAQAMLYLDVRATVPRG